MITYRKERFDNASAFFIIEHFALTGKPLTLPFFLKYIAYFDIEVLRKTGAAPFDFEYYAWESGPVPVRTRQIILNNEYYSNLVKIVASNDNDLLHLTLYPEENSQYSLDYFSENEVEVMFSLIRTYACRFSSVCEADDFSGQQYPSWEKAWNMRGKMKSHPMDLADEFPEDMKSRTEENLSPEENIFLAYTAVRGL